MKDKNSDTQVNLSNNPGKDIQDLGQETNWNPGEYHLNQQMEMKYLLQRKTMGALNQKEGEAWSRWIDKKITDLHKEMMTGQEPTNQAGRGPEHLEKTRMIMMNQEKDDDLAIKQFWNNRGQCEPVPFSSRPEEDNFKVTES